MKNTIIILLAVSLNISTYAMERQSNPPKRNKDETKPPSFAHLSPKSLVDTCLKTYSDAIKQCIDPKAPFENIEVIKQAIAVIQILNNDSLTEKLLNHLHENTQPIWRKYIRLHSNILSFVVADDPVTLPFLEQTTVSWLECEQNDFFHYSNISKPKLTHSYELPEGYDDNRGLIITPDQRYTAIAHLNELFLFDMINENQTIYYAPKPIESLAFSPDGTGFLGLRDGSCSFVKKDTNDMYVIENLNHFFSEPIRALELSSDGSVLVLSDGKSIAICYQKDSYAVKHTLTFPHLLEYTQGAQGCSIKGLKLSPDSSLLAINLKQTNRSLIYDFVHNSSIILSQPVIKIDHANRCICTRFAIYQGDNEDDEDDKYQSCLLDYVVPNCSDKSYLSSSYVLPKDSMCLVSYQKSATVNPLSIVIQKRGNAEPYLLLQKRVNLKKLLYLIALNKASKEELQALKEMQTANQSPFLKLFKKPQCDNVVKQYINHRLKQFEQKGSE